MFSAFAKSIAEHSGQSVKQYRRELGPAALEIFLKAAVNITAYMGWGGWTFRPNTPGEMALDVAKSTLPEKRGRSEPPAYGSMLGMMEAQGGVIFSVDPIVVETECVAVTGDGGGRFIVRMN